MNERRAVRGLPAARLVVAALGPLAAALAKTPGIAVVTRTPCSYQSMRCLVMRSYPELPELAHRKSIKVRLAPPD
jgi:hypothetical protein